MCCELREDLKWCVWAAKLNKVHSEATHNLLLYTLYAQHWDNGRMSRHQEHVKSAIISNSKCWLLALALYKLCYAVPSVIRWQTLYLSNCPPTLSGKVHLLKILDQNTWQFLLLWFPLHLFTIMQSSIMSCSPCGAYMYIYIYSKYIHRKKTSLRTNAVLLMMDLFTRYQLTF